MEIRAVWQRQTQPTGQSEGAIQLLACEADASNATAAFISLISKVDAFPDGEIKEVQKLCQAGEIDLVAGCEMARAGYFKQAYSLWRSWFEQSLFAIYFLESRLHRLAWKVRDDVKFDDSPAYRLMLHQLLTESGERHPFTIIYGERWLAILETLQISNPGKNIAPLARAIRVLTLFSQGVHGTYRPSALDSEEKVSQKLKESLVPALMEARRVCAIYWLLLIANAIDLPAGIWVALRQGTLTSAEAEAALKAEEPDALAPLAASAVPAAPAVIAAPAGTPATASTGAPLALPAGSAVPTAPAVATAPAGTPATASTGAAELLALNTAFKDFFESLKNG